MRTVYIFIALNAIIAVGCGGSPNTSQANTPSQSEINTTPKEESNTSTNTASLITARTYPIVDTNQHQCFNTIGVEIECNASGQDGAL